MIPLTKAIKKWLDDRFKKLDFVVVHYIDTGNFCIVEPHEAQLLIKDEPFGSVVVTSISMTRHKFESLPEFQGP